MNFVQDIIWEQLELEYITYQLIRVSVEIDSLYYGPQAGGW